ncbi:hypothetical protein BDV09DRAFT_196956 [Aspergillus tetrazonus]
MACGAIHCAGRAIAAPADGFRHGLDQLRYIERNGGISGAGGSLEPSMGLEPNTCGEVYCFYSTSIRWCNEDKKHYKTMLYQHIREGAQDIYHKCLTKYKGKDVSGGIIDHNDNWSVIVQEDARCKH